MSEKLYVSIEKAFVNANITPTIIIGKNISKMVDIMFLFNNIKFFFKRARNFQKYEYDIGIYIFSFFTLYIVLKN